MVMEMNEQNVTFAFPLKKILQVVAVVVVLWLLCMGWMGLFRALYNSNEIWEEFVRLKTTDL